MVGSDKGQHRYGWGDKGQHRYGEIGQHRYGEIALMTRFTTTIKSFTTTINPDSRLLALDS